MTKDVYYDISHVNRGVALIFNHTTFKDEKKTDRNGTVKDALDLKAVLEGLKFDVTVHKDLKAVDVKNVLYNGNT